MDDKSEYMKKFLQEKNPPTKIFHIYLKDRCVLHSLSEDQFKSNWELLNKLVGVMKTEYSVNDLSYTAVDQPSRELKEGSY